MKTRSIRTKATAQRSPVLAWIFLLIALSSLGGCIYYIYSIFSWGIYGYYLLGYYGTWAAYDIFMAVALGITSAVFFSLYMKYRSSARLVI